MHPLKIPDYAYSVNMHVHPHSDGKGDQYVSKAIADNGIWEPFETKLLLKLIERKQCFVDVGANLGYYSLIASPVMGCSASIFAFEPEPKNFTVFEKNIIDNQLNNIVAVNAGLGEKDESLKMFLSDDNYGDHQIYDAGLDRNSIDIDIVSGDRFLKEKGISRIDVIKMDTQGAEQFVVNGLEETLRNSLPNLSMIIEFWPFGLRKSGCHAHKLLDFLLSLELPLFIIDHINHGLIPCKESDLRPWIDDLENNPENEGFLNLFLGEVDLDD